MILPNTPFNRAGLRRGVVSTGPFPGAFLDRQRHPGPGLQFGNMKYIMTLLQQQHAEEKLRTR